MAPPFDKRLLCERFGKALELYEEEAKVQAEMAEALLEVLAPFDLREARVLEIGAGTGLFTRKLLASKTPALLITTDLVVNCKYHLPPCFFVVADGEAPPFKAESFDFVLSNATFQWFLDLKQAFKSLSRLLRPGGLLGFTTFGPHTMKEFGLKERPPGLKGLDELKALKPPGLVEVKAFSWRRVLYFSSVKDVLLHVKKTGAMGFLPVKWSLGELKAWERRYQKTLTPQGYPLTFEPILVMWQKK